VTAAFFTGVDGVIADPQNWHFPYLSPQLAAEVRQQTCGAAALVLGRRTYESWAAVWPDAPASDPLARHLNTMPKLVASRTLTEVTWQNSTLLPGDAVDAITALANQDGAALAVAGSPTLVRSLLHAGVLTELRLVVHPLVVGTGDRLFSQGQPMPLSLRDCNVHDNGVVVLVTPDKDTS
jgi:dihydrofolate reductase